MDKQKLPNIEQVIQNYIHGKASEEEQQFIYDWLKKNPDNRKILFAEKDLIAASKLGSKVLNEVEIEQWTKLQNWIKTHNLKVSHFREFLKIAAVIVIALGAGWLGHYLYASYRYSVRNVELKQIEATKGQIKEIFLVDGTHVWLNSDSKLSFPSSFKNKNREVELQGEAYFEVTANKEYPFLVKTKNHKVKVTGTKFNICEYPESKIIETTLVEGKVKIISGNIIKDLFPGQQSSFNTKTSKVRISKKDFEIYTAWKDGRYEFRNEPIGKIFQIIERWWDVKIVYPEKRIKNERISGVLRRHKSLEQHFDVIKQLIPIEYKIEDDVINVVLRDN